jgi:hypothetical protein
VSPRELLAYICIWLAVAFVLFWLAANAYAAEPVQISVEFTPAAGPVWDYEISARACDMHGNVGPQSEWSGCFALPEPSTPVGVACGAVLLAILGRGR